KSSTFSGTRCALFRLAFATAPPHRLNLAQDRHSPVHSAIGTPSHLQGSPQSNTLWGGWVLRLLVGTRFQVLFHSPPGVLFTFPSRYWFTIGRQGVFSLGRWSSLLPTGFPVSRRTQDPPRSASGFGYVAVTLYGPPFQTCSPTLGPFPPCGT